MSVYQLKESFQSLSDMIRSSDLRESYAAVEELIGLLNSIAESHPADSEDALVEVDQFIASPESDQTVVDAISLELPKVAIKFACVSEKCELVAGNIIEHLVDRCSPRDLLPILCEALDTHLNVSKEPVHYVLLLNGISKVLLNIQRRQIEQVKTSLPVVLEAVLILSSDSNESERGSLPELFHAACRIGTSIQKICDKLEGRREELCGILGLYALQIIALISRSNLSHEISDCVPLILEFKQFLKFCGLSYCDLITGRCLELISSTVSQGDVDEFMPVFTLVMDGASLAVIWDLISDQVSEADRQQLNITLSEIRDDPDKKWQVVSMLKSSLSPIHYSWEINLRSVELLLKIIDGSDLKESHDSLIDLSSRMVSIFAVLKNIERIIMCAPDGSSRKKVFGALKKVVSNLPSAGRFDILTALVTNSDSPSMMAIYIDLFKEEINKKYLQEKISSVDDTRKVLNESDSSPFWSPRVFDVVELVLKPPNGGPPPLPDHFEPVLSALNLYRFIFILESSGGTNQTGVLSENMLRKAYSDWLLPLKTLIMRVQSENANEDIICALAPIQLVLHRCIELVEEKLRTFS